MMKKHFSLFTLVVLAVLCSCDMAERNEPSELETDAIEDYIIVDSIIEGQEFRNGRWVDVFETKDLEDTETQRFN